MFFLDHEIHDFWKSFNNGRGPRPLLLKRPFSNMIATDDALLTILKSWAEAGKLGRAGPIDIDKIDQDALPDVNDETLDACIRRIQGKWDKDWYAYINDVQQYSGDLWERAVEIILPAIRANGGLPAGGFKMEFFFGKYGSTPTGIHLDTSDNLAFILRGPKRMVFWPSGRFRSRLQIPDAKAPTHEQALIGRYEDHMNDAIVLDADAGDVIYWPKEYWHVGSSPANWTAMITIAMWWNARPLTVARFLLDRCLELDGEPQLHPFNPDSLVEQALTLPDTVRRPIGDVKSQISNIDSVSSMVWASLASCYGFTVPPAKVVGSPVTDSAQVRLQYPVIALPWGNTHIIFACGHRMHTSISKVNVGLSRLNSAIGAEYTVRELKAILLANASDGAPLEKECMRLIAELISSRAFAITSN
jgi:50S ribosomal protein L16 3-hydroxylase